MCCNSLNYEKFIFTEKIRVGKDYQVVCPELIPITDRKPETLNDRALLVWSPTKDIPESKCKATFITDDRSLETF